MPVSFRDYVTITKAFEDAQMDEGAIWAAVKKKLGSKDSDEEVQAKIDTLKGANKAKATKDLDDQKVQAHAEAASKSTRPTQKPRGTVSHSSVQQDTANEELQAELDEYLAEGVCEFTVTYTTKQGGGGKKSRMDIKGRDVKEVRRKFADLFFGHKLLNIAPCKTKPKREEPAEDLDEAHEEHGPLGPRS